MKSSKKTNLYGDYTDTGTKKTSWHDANLSTDFSQNLTYGESRVDHSDSQLLNENESNEYFNEPENSFMDAEPILQAGVDKKYK